MPRTAKAVRGTVHHRRELGCHTRNKKPQRVAGVSRRIYQTVAGLWALTAVASIGQRCQRRNVQAKRRNAQGSRTFRTLDTGFQCSFDFGMKAMQTIIVRTLGHTETRRLGVTVAIP